MDDVLLIENLSKVYVRKGEHKIAVKEMNLSIKRGACFGLLGINGNISIEGSNA